MMAVRGLKIDHSTLNQWVVHYAPKLKNAFHKKKKQPANRWRIDETYLKVKGEWSRFECNVGITMPLTPTVGALGEQGNTYDFLLTAKRDSKAAKRFFNKSIGRNGKPDRVISTNTVDFLLPADQFYGLAA